MRVLLIDDDARLAELLRDYFEPQDIALSHTASGGAGLAAVSQGSFDAMFLDVMMPGMDTRDA
jgi:two-component system, OmpR family, response regulator